MTTVPHTDTNTYPNEDTNDISYLKPTITQSKIENQPKES